MEKKKKGKADDRKSVELANMFKLIQGLGINDSEELISELGKREDEKLNDEEANALRNIFPRKQDSSSLQAGEESGLDSRVVSAALPENKLNDHQQASSSTKQAKNQRKYLKKKNKKNQLKIANQQAYESLSTSLGVANVDSNDTEPFISEHESEIPQEASESLALSGLRSTESIEENRDSISSSGPGFSSTSLGVASVDSNDMVNL